MDIRLNQPNQVMEPLSVPELQEKPGYIYQVKWDGVRILCHIETKQVRLWNKRLNERTLQYPELEQAARLVKAGSAILDGEVVVLKNGKPSFPSVMSRDNCRTLAAVNRQQAVMPAQYMVFDLLYLDGQALDQIPLGERREMLNHCFEPGSGIHLVEDFYQGALLFDAVKNQSMEGVVAKREDSPYIQGKHHQAWFKHKNRLRLNAVVGAFILEGRQLKSLVLGLMHEKGLVYIGRASTGLNEDQKTLLLKDLPGLKSELSPFQSTLPGHKNLVYIRPVLTVLVEFAEWSEDLRLRSPVIVGFSPKPPEECQLAVPSPS